MSVMRSVVPVTAGADGAEPILARAWPFLVVPMLLMSAVRGLWAPDEPRYAEVAREIWTLHDPVVMHLCGEVYPDKPPLLFVLSGVLGAASGWSEAAMRLVSIGATLATAVLVGALARRWFGAREAAWAPIVYSSTILVLWVGARLQIDPLLTALDTGSLYLLFTAPSRLHPARARLAAGFLLGLGALAKGPVAWSNVGLVVLACAWLAPAPEPRRRWTWKTAVGVAALAVVPVGAWAAAAIAREPALAEPLLFGQHVARIGEARSHPGPPWQQLLQMLAGLLPWTLPAAVQLVHTARTWSRRSHGQRTCVLWWCALLLFFSVISEKRELYLLPAYPAAALLAARWLASCVAGEQPAKRWVMAPSSLLLTLLGVAACFAVLFVDDAEFANAIGDRPTSLAWRGVLVGVPTAMLGGLSLRAALAARPRAWAAWQAVTVGVAVALAAVLVLPMVDDVKSPRALAHTLATRPERPRVVPSVGVRPEGYRFYSGRAVVEGDLERALAAEGENFMALLERGSYESLPPATRAQMAVAASRHVGSRDVLLVVRAAAPR